MVHHNHRLARRLHQGVLGNPQCKRFHGRGLFLGAVASPFQSYVAVKESIEGVFAKRFETIKILLILNQQQITKQLTVNNRLWNRNTALQQIGVRLHRYVITFVLPGYNNGFYSFIVREQRLQKDSTILSMASAHSDCKPQRNRYTIDEL